MAQYVLLSFDDDDEAEKFIATARSKDYYVKAGEGGTFIGLENLGDVVGVFRKPTQFCECTPEEKRGTTGFRGPKYGWYVCGRCRKPPANGNQVIFNLLENDGRPTWKRVLCLQVLAAIEKKFP